MIPPGNQQVSARIGILEPDKVPGRDGSPGAAAPPADDVTPRSRCPWPYPRRLAAASRPACCASGRTTATTPWRSSLPYRRAIPPGNQQGDAAARPGLPPHRPLSDGFAGCLGLSLLGLSHGGATF